jgi:hypothetical protein
MIEMPEVIAFEIKAMNHAGVEIGNEELLMLRVEREAAERGRRIGHAIQRDIGE